MRFPLFGSTPVPLPPSPCGRHSTQHMTGYNNVSHIVCFWWRLATNTHLKQQWWQPTYTLSDQIFSHVTGGASACASLPLSAAIIPSRSIIKFPYILIYISILKFLAVFSGLPTALTHHPSPPPVRLCCLLSVSGLMCTSTRRW